MADTTRLTIRSRSIDPRCAKLLADASALGVDLPSNPNGRASIDVADVVFFDGPLADTDRQALAAVFVDDALQTGSWELPDGNGIEVGKLPGVTDASAQAIMLAAAVVGAPLVAAATASRYEFAATVDSAVISSLAKHLLCNAVIERWQVGTLEPTFITAHSDTTLDIDVTTETVLIRGADDQQLAAINSERSLSLDPLELRVIADHYLAEGRDPTDVELETLAQTWSEHCAHKTFRASISTDQTTVVPLLVQLRNATDAINAPFLRSAFVGNAGIVSFHPGSTIAVKAETHNHPSAIEPFGGANTGVGGVIRDVMGAAHHPIAVTNILCFGPADLPASQVPTGVLHPRLVQSGVVAGVADYGNKIGLPTVAGAVLFDPGYIANPLVYAGCIGIAAADAPVLTGPHAGDLVVVLGGGTGRDGLRGATFSSATMDATTGDVAGASVQIGDPITEKLLIDLLADAGGLYSAITDCGAGGLSSAVGEMAEHCGADVDLALVPLKYAGLRPWEIWLSEAQERMVVAVPPDRWGQLQRLCKRHGVVGASIGSFTGDGRLRVHHNGSVVLNMLTAFLHDGRPQRSMHAQLPTPNRQPQSPPQHVDIRAAVLALLGHPNIASNEAIIRRYDHEILGTSVVRPLVGVCHDGPADGVVLARPDDQHGIAIGIGVNPWYGEIDPERMALAVVDEAIRNVVAVGADPDQIALLDNFSWGDPRRPETLGSLVAAVKGCCDASMVHRAPFVSGKDSLNNEYLGSDGLRHAVPPTLVITAVAHVPDADRTVTPDLKHVGHSLVLIGCTHSEFGGSHLYKVLGIQGGAVPDADPNAPKRYRRLHQALLTGRISACHDVSEGGVAVAVAEMAIASRLGVRVQLDGSEQTQITSLFSESTGRFVVELAANAIPWLEQMLDESVVVLGSVIADPIIQLGDDAIALSEAVAAFHGGPR